MVNLETTNWLLGAIAAASVLQTVMLVALGIVGFRFYRQTTAALEELESRHVAPLRRQVDGVLTQVNSVLSEAQSIAARVNHQTERVDGAITDTIERVDETADRLKERVRGKVSEWTGVVRGIRAVITALLTSEPSAKPPAAAAGGRV
jgi:uncharacterized protein YoxC